MIFLIYIVIVFKDCGKREIILVRFYIVLENMGKGK